MTHSAALNYKAIVRILGTILFIIGISMIIPWLYAEFAKEPESARAFRICAPITAVFGLLIMVTIKNHTVKFRSREGYLVVALCWLIASIAGAFPYYISGHAGNFSRCDLRVYSRLLQQPDAPPSMQNIPSRVSYCGKRSLTGLAAWGSWFSSFPSCLHWG